MRSATRLWLAAAAVSLALLSGCGNADSGGYTVADDKDAFPQAVTLYQASCLACHGNDLQGRMNPQSNLSQVGARYDKDAIIGIVREGRDLMPSFKDVLSEEDFQALAEWLATKK
ncbi:cytochrome c [Xylanibacillus composti]|uniref:Cytochrome c domain-containing protein n=1 Tax=Xylanibacillus composti TaxID=1572762 RepID=A0A8J4M349_9BACL|nr:cytochrome c [Xylanibacillus composti]MDT9725844.1 cytochrome c [Xylanibacillus composti]GIQ69201.1 hypothetical protein XYCOK13_20250 [Xylanibacillus composti]